MTTTNAVRKAIFPAAGLGTRFLPATKALPKEMLPLVDKPTIQYGIEEARASGIKQVIMVTNGAKRAIADHFAPAPVMKGYLEQRGKADQLRRLSEIDRLAIEVEIAHVNQTEPLGLGHAVWTARNLVGNEAVAVLLADDVILDSKPCLGQLIAAHMETGATVLAARRVAPEETGRYGIISTGASRGRLHEVRDVVEKPARGTAPSNLAIIGRYVLNPAVLRELDRTRTGAGGEIQLTDAIRQSIATSKVVALEFEGDYYDTGTVPGYLKANLALGLQREDLRDELLQTVREMVDRLGLKIAA